MAIRNLTLFRLVRKHVNAHVLLFAKASRMKEWKDVFVFSHPWETTVEAAYRKYPNPHSSNVHTLDTVQRRVTSTGGLLSHRIFGTRWNIPTIALNIIGTNPVMRVNEHSLCDPHTKTLTIEAKNITLGNLFTVHETLEYRVNPEDPTTTVLCQTARVDVHGVPLLGDLLERLFIHNYSSTVSNGRQGVEFVAQSILDERS